MDGLVKQKVRSAADLGMGHPARYAAGGTEADSAIAPYVHHLPRANKFAFTVQPLARGRAESNKDRRVIDTCNF